MQGKLTVYGETYESRLLLGTSRYESPAQLAKAVEAASPALLTVALRKQIEGGAQAGQAFWDILRATGRPLLPNTAGCFTAKDAIATSCMAREVFETDLVKLEVIGDDANLQPDPFGLVEAAVDLVKRGFKVMPYCTEDLVLCRRLLDAGCQVLMPWAAPIGTGQGPRNPKGLRELRERIPNVMLIVDAGLGLPSHACQVMEWGFDAVLLNTAVSRAIDPVCMARSFAGAIECGRLGYLSGPMPVQELAVPSTPDLGKLFSTEAPRFALEGASR
jgi:thiazole synthase